jgi:hypothetical protein
MQEKYNPGLEEIENENKKKIKESNGGIIYETGPEEQFRIYEKKFIRNGKEEVLNYEKQKKKIEEKTLSPDEQKIKEFEDNYNSIFKEFLDKIEWKIYSIQNPGIIIDEKKPSLNNYSTSNSNDQKLFLDFCKNKNSNDYKMLKRKIDELDGLIENMKSEKLE